jgi:hypothetical protein
LKSFVDLNEKNLEIPKYKPTMKNMSINNPPNGVE